MATLAAIRSIPNFRISSVQVSNVFTGVTRNCFVGTLGFRPHAMGRPVFRRQINQIDCPLGSVRALSTKILAPLEDGEFFNRSREIEDLKGTLSDEPQISIITGPVNSGKTSLILKVLKELSDNDNRPVLHLDLRSKSFNSVNSLTSSLSGELQSWLDRFAAIGKRLELKVSESGVTLNAAKFEDASQLSPVDRLNNLFGEMDKELPSHSWLRGKRTPILFIDEASKLQNLLTDKKGGGHAAISDMFEWFVRNTKQDHRFHVVLGSSDSFFHLWVEEFLGASRVESYVIGDLSKEEAARFWSERIVTYVNERNSELPVPAFEDAYQVCGGNMFYLKNYGKEYVRRKGEMKPEYFSLIRKERVKLTQALFTNTDHLSLEDHKEKKIYWSTKDLISVMKKLVNAQEGFLDHELLCAEVGRNVVKSLIAHNLLHLRPSKEYSYDLATQEPNQAIVTPETPASLIAMKMLLSDIAKKKLSVMS